MTQRISILDQLRATPLLLLRALKWRAYRGGWIWEYLTRHRPFDATGLPDGQVIDVIVTLVDHFEPPIGQGPEAAARSVESWVEAYRGAAVSHRDSAGRVPQHSWFYRSENRNDACLRALCEAVFDGYGEIEFHLHHGHDDHDGFKARLRDGLNWFGQRGAMLGTGPEPWPQFAYIAGNWALDNGAGDDALSGCNTELWALRESGCFADFTFPAFGSPAQPSKTNAIYHAQDDRRPKSYDRGLDLRAGEPGSGDLVIFQGPLGIAWHSGRFEDAALELGNPPSPERLDAWLSAHVHVKGRPEWVFIKLHTHGMQSRDAILGDGMQQLWSAMRERWTRPPFRLHFAAAREAYNMARAAEAGNAGNPADYRDFEVPLPANRRICCDGRWSLATCTADRVVLRAVGPELRRVRLHDFPVREIRGSVRAIELNRIGGRMETVRIDADAALELSLAGGSSWSGTADRLNAGELNRLLDAAAQTGRPPDSMP